PYATAHTLSLHDALPIYFQDINGKLPKIAEAGIAGAEVIHRKVNPHRFELLKYGGRGFGILHKDAFGDLEFEIARFQASFQEYRDRKSTRLNSSHQIISY